MSTVKANTFQDASGGNTATINGMTPTADSLQGFRNRIINGAMMIDQRNAGASVAVTSELYTLDRWYFAVSALGKLTCQQNAGSVTPPAGFSKYLGITSSSAYSVLTSDIFALKQSIEGFNFADMNWGTASASTVTLSFWVRSSLTGTFGASLNNGAFNRSYPFSYTINAANTWEQKSVTIAGDTTGTWVGATNGVGLRLYWNLGAGSTYYGGTANTWNAGLYIAPSATTSVVGTNGATFYITGVQLEAGSVATPFERRDYGRELIMCQRYYWKYTRTTNSILGVFFPSNWHNGSGDGVLRLPVTMRSTPTAAFEAAGNYSFHQRGLASGALSSISLSQGDVDAVQISTSSATVGAINYAQIYANAGTSVSMAFSSEL